MQHGVGRAAHGDVERHGILESALAGDVARQHAGIFLFVITAGEIDDQVSGFQEQLLARGMGCQCRAIARQRQAQGLGQAVHRIRGEHAGAGTAGWAGRPLDDLHVLFAHPVVGSSDHGIDEVERLGLAAEHNLAGLHRSAGDEDCRDVETQRRHQHARRDLVAVRDAHHGVGAMRIHHVFDAVGDEFARGQRIQHAVMAHGDAVIDGNGVEFLGDAARRLDLARHHLAEILQMHMARHELGEGVDHRDDRLAEIAVLHAGGAPEAARARHVAAVGGGAGTICGHVGVRICWLMGRIGLAAIQMSVWRRHGKRE